MINKKNKKGVLPIVVVAWILGIGALTVFGSSYLLANKTSNIFSQIPTIVWVFFGILMVALMLRRRK